MYGTDQLMDSSMTFENKLPVSSYTGEKQRVQGIGLPAEPTCQGGRVLTEILFFFSSNSILNGLTMHSQVLSCATIIASILLP